MDRTTSAEKGKSTTHAREHRGYNHQNKKTSTPKVQLIETYDNTCNTGKVYYAGILTGSIYGAAAIRIQKKVLQDLLTGALASYPITARCKSIPLCLKVLVLPLSHNPVYQAAIAPVLRWARELHLSTSNFAVEKRTRRLAQHTLVEKHR